MKVEHLSHLTFLLSFLTQEMYTILITWRWQNFTKTSIRFYNMNGDEIEKEMVNIKWDAEAAEKGGFEHFMMKEIHEQPKAAQRYNQYICKRR